MEIKQVKIGDITPYAANTKKHDQTQIDNVAESIRKFGFVQPLVIDRDGVVVIGHCRLLAAQKLGMDEVPCVRVDDLTDKQVKALRIIDNKTNESPWDMDLLELELPDIDDIMADFDMDFGIDFDEEPGEIVEDEAPEVEEGETICKPGEVWQLGNHRLMCGDSTDREQVAKLMGGEKADMVFTDPPYGMKKEAEGVSNDNLNQSDLLDFNKKWIPVSFENLKENGSWYCWGVDEPLMDIYSNILKPMMAACQLTFRNLITWNKGSTRGMKAACGRMYPPASEKCLFAMRGVQWFNTNQDNYYEGWEPIRSYLAEEWAKCSSKNDWDEKLGNHMGKHYFTKSQWLMPTEHQYEKMQEIGREHSAFLKPYEEIKKQYEEIKKQYEEIKKQYYSTRAYFDNTHENMTDVWDFPTTTGAEREEAGGHATPKPIVLCTRAIRSSSREGETVLDLFGGSGSTLIACEQNERACRMMELEPHWCDVIIKRWENFTGETATILEERG